MWYNITNKKYIPIINMKGEIYMRIDSEQATKEFIENLKNGKFTREPYPDFPSDSEENFEAELENYDKFLKSPIGQHIINM